MFLYRFGVGNQRSSHVEEDYLDLSARKLKLGREHPWNMITHTIQTCLNDIGYTMRISNIWNVMKLTSILLPKYMKLLKCLGEDIIRTSYRYGPYPLCIVY